MYLKYEMKELASILNGESIEELNCEIKYRKALINLIKSEIKEKRSLAIQSPRIKKEIAEAYYDIQVEKRHIRTALEKIDFIKDE